MDKSKRKHQPQEKSTGLLDALTVPAVEFLSPLPLNECVRRLDIKRRNARRSPTKFEAQLWKTEMDSYRFILRRTIEEGDYRGRKNITRVRVTGTLSFWDETSTLVTCKAEMGFHPGYILVFLALYLLGMSIYAAVQTPGDLSPLILPLIALPIIGMAVYIVWLGIAIEHRKLVMLVEDMLRDPIFL